MRCEDVLVECVQELTMIDSSKEVATTASYAPRRGLGIASFDFFPQARA